MNLGATLIGHSSFKEYHDEDRAMALEQLLTYALENSDG